AKVPFTGPTAKSTRASSSTTSAQAREPSLRALSAGLSERPKGYGVYHYATDDQYRGHFSQGIKHGIGVYYYANRDVFEGEYRNGTRYKGVLKLANGNIFE